MGCGNVKQAKFYLEMKGDWVRVATWTNVARLEDLPKAYLKGDGYHFYEMPIVRKPANSREVIHEKAIYAKNEATGHGFVIREGERLPKEIWFEFAKRMKEAGDRLHQMTPKKTKSIRDKNLVEVRI